MDYKSVFAVLSVLTAFIQYGPYIRDVVTRKTVPHAFSWFVWGLPAGIVFAAQLLNGGGKGAWATGITTILCTAIFILSLFRGEKHITRLDWISLLLALVAIGLWVLTNDPLASVVLVSLADTLGCVPTARKSWDNPYEETVSTYAIGIAKWFLSLFALDSFTLVTTIYPLMMFVSNGALVALLLWRRKIIAPKL